ncbi:UbiA prenyltransferase family protein [Candidatus Nitronereus thalassa]|uniref:UbiA prenyltransferase family protein n=1 Tax=Candidatus Nitronereus thalassa TaxID=3020898 RepID=A0ABU3K6G4_9BACT|nr:UbiA prenyltransferase family protein [Candidatus Nitronereus thalassa]MDT7041971.1 UbiA prenyltransferase family protein [Candidatus Nitronereus thalassa]
MNSAPTSHAEMPIPVKPQGENGTREKSGKLPPSRPTFWGHVQIARIDHWFKNVFVFPGIVVALGLDPSLLSTPGLPIQLFFGLLAVCLVASSNYVVNEVLDAPNDRLHPTKCNRPVPSGKVSIPLAYVQWIFLMVVGLGIALQVSFPFAMTMLVLWIMGCIYNIPPVRSKDLPYLDVLSEAVNNPLRMMAGWYIAGAHILPPASLLISYWMIGCYFMAMKRFSEYRHIDDPVRAAAYRKSFSFYTEPRLLVSVMFYGSAAMLFFGSFLIRYRFELILAFPILAFVMATYLSLAFKENSAVQNPEGLYREPALMTAVITCTLTMAILMFIDIPFLYETFHPSLPLTK